MNKKQEGFLTPYKKTWVVKTWALMALIAGLLLFGIGMTMLSLTYVEAIERSSLTTGWSATLLGIGFYVVSFFGMKSPKQIKKEKEKEDQK